MAIPAVPDPGTGRTRLRRRASRLWLAWPQHDRAGGGERSGGRSLSRDRVGWSGCREVQNLNREHLGHTS